MKKFILISSIILLVANLLFGLILTAYPTFNMGINTAVIICTCALLYTLQVINIKDAFAISLSFLFGFLGFVEFILGCFAPKQFEDNWYLLVVIVLLTLEGVLLLTTHLVSK